MVVDSLNNAASYYALGPLIQAALEFLKSHDFSALESGRVDIRGDGCYALIQRYESRPREMCKWESHKRYIDVQFVAEGQELIGWAPLESMSTKTPYNDAKDQTVHEGQGSLVRVPAGFFAILGPRDAHMPCVADGEGSAVTKVVVKVAV